MRLIAIETSTEACSVAFLHDHHIDSRFAVIPQQHAQKILLMLDELLRANDANIKDCDAIVFGQGPGSFTGLRIAAAVAQGLAFAHQLPLIPISSLACLAFEALVKFPEAEYFLPCVDARMQEVYFGLYQRAGHELKSVMEDSIMKPSEALATLAGYAIKNQWVGIGNGWPLCEPYVDLLPKPFMIKEAFPTAEYLIQLGQRAFEKGEIVNVSDALPKYVREKFL